LVRQQSAHGLRLHTIIGRNPGGRLRAQRRHELTQAARHGLLPAADQVLAVTSRLAVVAGLRQQSTTLDHAGMQRLRHGPADAQRLTVEGSGAI
jgi:hypothetical protein